MSSILKECQCNVNFTTVSVYVAILTNIKSKEASHPVSLLKLFMF